MNKEKFKEIVTQPEKIQDSDLAELQQIVRDYPYFHNAHFLLLYGLNRRKPEKFDEQLKQSAMHLNNRSFLVNAMFYGLKDHPVSDIPATTGPTTDTIVEKMPVPEEVVKTEPEISVSEVSVVEPSVALEFAHEDSFEFSLDDPNSAILEVVEKKEEETPARQTSANDLLEIDLNPTFNEEESLDLIDHFLKVNPRIVPKIDLVDSRGDISQPGLEESDDLVTETLADIYEQQGHFLKAKEAFQKLILKFPEKSTYFASRIQELEKRIK